MIPILLALTIVLLLWTARTLFGSTGYSFVQLSGIATAYAFYGFWLHVMTRHHQTATARFYRRVFPFAALIILMAEAWALWRQFNLYGLKYTEYGFLIVWIFAIKSVGLILFTGEKAHRRMALIAGFLAFAVVLPGIGFHDLPITMQVNRLEDLLTEEKILVDGELIAATTSVSDERRRQITDAIYFLVREDEAELPAWLEKNLNNQLVFEETLGFSPLWPEPDVPLPGGGNFLGTSMRLSQGALRIDDYDWALRLDPYDDLGREPVVLEGEKGTYRVSWIADGRRNLPTIRVESGGEIVLEDGFDAFMDEITRRHPPGEQKMQSYGFEEMSATFETEELRILVVFTTIEINVDVQRDEIFYWLELNSVFIEEK